MTSKELRVLLDSHDIRPIRDRGQHFLLDERVVEKIVEAARVKEGDRVVEIGPGPGILTEKLLAVGAEVVAVELDLKLAALLRERFVSPRFHLILGDALDFSNKDLVSFFDSRPLDPSTPRLLYKVVANLPYAITSAVLQKFLFGHPRPTSLTVMIQREVADRILAKPPGMSSLSVMVRALGTVSRAVDVPAGAFLPPPKVESAVVHIAPKSDVERQDFFGSAGEERFFSVVRRAFSQPRKQIRNTLSGLMSAAKIAEAGVRPEARPQELTVQEWRKLSTFGGRLRGVDKRGY